MSALCPWLACRARAWPGDKTRPRSPPPLSIHPHFLQRPQSRPEKGGGPREWGRGVQKSISIKEALGLSAGPQQAEAGSGLLSPLGTLALPQSGPPLSEGR